MQTMRLNAVLVLAAVLLSSSVRAAAAEPKLKVGDAAPALAVGQWVQGEPVTQFDRDKAYLVEFWATWCGPCRATIPHLNEIHRKFQTKGLVVIGQDVWENDEKEVPRFVKSMGEKMSYRVVLDDKQGSSKGRMAETWMDAAGRGGIPSAFLVDKKGLIAWIGHPTELKESAIEQVLAGTFDIEKARNSYQQKLANEGRVREAWQRLSEGMAKEDWPAVDRALAELEKMTPEESRINLDLTRFRVQLEKKDFAGARDLSRSISKTHKEDANLLNELAWAFATAGNLDKETLTVAQEIASQANAASGGKDGAILDTLARLVFMSGEKDKAIELQSKAVEAAEPEMRAELKKTLDSYRAGKLPQAE